MTSEYTLTDRLRDAVARGETEIFLSQSDAASIRFGCRELCASLDDPTALTMDKVTVFRLLWNRDGSAVAILKR